jgi:RNA polymerase sigma-70 factor (ECF subfamily)
MVLEAGGGQGASAGRALADLCECYWLPLYAFARRKCDRREEAQDLTQAFFADILERKLLNRADPARGRFRTFLLSAFQHFMHHAWERQRAAKRGGGRTPLSLDFGWADSRLSFEPAVRETAEHQFERLWALQLLESSLETLRKQYETRGQSQLYDTLKPFMLGEQGDLRLAQAAEQLAISESVAKVAVHRLRTRFREALREEIAATVREPSDVDDEIRRLFAAFS